MVENIGSSTRDDGAPGLEIQNKYKQFISALPKDDGSTFPGAESHQYQYQGFWYYAPMLEGLLAAQDNFKAQPSDIFICSAPKSGTAWLKSLSYVILTRKIFNDDKQTNPTLTNMPHDLIPLLEIDVGPLGDQFNRDSLQVPLLATHTSYPSLPKSIISEGCKIVYICRNPKDAFLSLWHFINKITSKTGTDPEPVPIEKLLDLFCQGISFCGPYWGHALGYWKASLERPDKIFFLKYEEMMADTGFYVRRLAEFLGEPFSAEEEGQGVVEKIVEMCSFEKLSNLDVNKNGKHRGGTSLEVDSNVYFRKGKVGGWENDLTQEMSEKIDQITNEKLKGCGLIL